MADNNGSLFEIPPLDEELIGGSSGSKFDHTSSGPFSSFSPPPLPPPLDSFADFSYPSENTNDFSSAGGNNLADDNTGFGDFSSAFPPPPVASNDLPVAKESPAGNHGNNNDEDEFGDMTGFEFTTNIPPVDTNGGFGSFSASIAPGQDSSEKDGEMNGFGDFTAAPTAVNEQSSFAVDFDQHNKSSSGGTSTNPSHDAVEDVTEDKGKNDQFGDFSSTGFTPDNDDFGDFTTSITVESSSTTVQSSSTDNNAAKQPFNAFTTSSNDSGDDFGSFTQTTTTFPSSTFQQPPPLPDDDGDDDFGDFGEFSSKPTPLAAPMVTPPTTIASATPTTEQVKVPTDILKACFPLNVINQLEQNKGTLFNDSSVSSLSKQTSSTDILYQWNQSLLQDRFFNALKVDPMLVPASGSTGGVDTDPFALSNLLTDLGGTGIEMKPSSFNWPKEASDEVGGATLLDLSLPMSPIGKDGKDSEGLMLDEDLKTLDFNAPSSEQSVGVVREVEVSSSWMDSELLELEQESQEPATGVGSGNASRSEGGGSGGLEWLNNPKLTTMVKPITDNSVDLLPSLEPTSSSIIELERSTTQQESQQVATNQHSTSNGLVSVDVKGSDNIASLSPSPDPSMVGLIPPDPILSMPTTNNVAPDPLPPLSVSDPPLPLSAPDPPPLSVPEQEKMQVASFGLDMVMEMTSQVTTASSPSSFVPARDSTPSNDSRVTLSPTRSIDILEDQILEITMHKEKLNNKQETMETNRSLSKEARIILQKLPNLTFMRR